MLAQVAQWLISPFIVLTLVVTVHEFGHFLAARAFGVKVDRFSIGFGRPIVHWTDRRGVDWRFGWIPLGGYVRFAGDESAASVPDHEDLKRLRAEVTAAEGAAAVRQYFHFKPVWQRAIIVAAGPVTNFLLAIVLFAIVFLWIGLAIAPTRLDRLDAAAPAAQAGLKPGDMIVAVDGRVLGNAGDLVAHVSTRAGVPITFDVARGADRFAVEIVPEEVRRRDPLGVYNKVGSIGVEIGPPRRDEVRLVRLNPVQAVAAGFDRTWTVLSTTTQYLGRVVTGRASADQLGGPLRIAHTAGGVTKLSTEGAESFGAWMKGATIGLLSLSALLSVGIGFMNLLPIPVLDGGHLAFYAYEAVARRPLGARVQDAGYRLGLALLLGLMVFVTWNDIQNLRVFQFLGGLVS